jgi:hypothetical protein
VGGIPLTLRVSGKVLDGNLVMYDEQTGTIWLQKTGAALGGSLLGKSLKELPKKDYEPGIRWDEWLAKHPDTKVLHCDHCLPRHKSPRD